MHHNSLVKYDPMSTWFKQSCAVQALSYISANAPRLHVSLSCSLHMRASLLYLDRVVE